MCAPEVQTPEVFSIEVHYSEAQMFRDWNFSVDDIGIIKEDFQITHCGFVDTETIRVNFVENGKEAAVLVNGTSGHMCIRYDRDLNRSPYMNKTLKERAMKFHDAYSQSFSQA